MAMYILSLFICYLIFRNGVKQSGKIVLFTATFPYILFIIMLLRGLFLTGAMEGLSYLFDFKGNLFNPSIWLEAIVQVFYQLTLACAGIVHLSSMKPKNQ
jgi:solute carrier family 6 GABA transporter-like protein 1